MKFKNKLEWLYGTTIFLSAFLLFALEPIIAKYILPWYGGGSSVWTTCLLFFMIVLLFGYIYADVLSKQSLKNQTLIHTALVFLTLGFEVAMIVLWKSPLTPDGVFRNDTNLNPTLSVLILLFTSVGLPYFLLSSTSSILQSWFSNLSTENPYNLYRLSNAGSLIALVSYPFLLEPNLDTFGQGRLWGYSFFVICILLACSIWFFSKNRNFSERKNESQISKNPIRINDFVYWTALSAFASFMLVSITAKITQGIASVPFLWILPLSLYLLSYIIAFRDKTSVPISIYGGALIIVSSLSLAFWYPNHILNNFWIILIFLILLLLACVTVNRKLYLSRPEKEGLTKFYLAISIGGVVGGAFVSVISPLIFSSYIELPFGLVLSILIGYSTMTPIISRINSSLISKFSTGSVFVISFAIFVAIIDHTYLYKPLDQVRNFYGVVTVSEKNTAKNGLLRTITNGNIIHGNQLIGGEFEKKATSYYGDGSGINLAMEAVRQSKKKALSVGIIGLGAGGIAAYCDNYDSFKFYEINPAVVEIANKDFSYLKNCAKIGKVETVVDDARLGLEQDSLNKADKFDILVVDAFSDDAIPVHLLTKEAVSLYLERLAEEGILAVHISNTYLDLKPVLKNHARSLKLSAQIITNKPDQTDNIFAPSVWVLLSRNKKILNTKRILSSGSSLNEAKDIRDWTDAFSSLFPILN